MDVSSSFSWFLWSNTIFSLSLPLSLALSLSVLCSKSASVANGNFGFRENYVYTGAKVCFSMEFIFFSSNVNQHFNSCLPFYSFKCSPPETHTLAVRYNGAAPLARRHWLKLEYAQGKVNEKQKKKKCVESCLKMCAQNVMPMFGCTCALSMRLNHIFILFIWMNDEQCASKIAMTLDKLLCSVA